jgi:hypothetical protein
MGTVNQIQVSDRRWRDSVRASKVSLKWAGESAVQESIHSQQAALPLVEEKPAVLRAENYSNLAEDEKDQVSEREQARRA